MADESEAKTLSCTEDELASGVRLLSGSKHRIIVERRITVEGQFTAEGNVPILDFPFELRRGAVDGTALTPANLDGKSQNRFEYDYWWSGDEGRYEFEGLEPGEYYVVYPDDPVGNPSEDDYDDGHGAMEGDEDAEDAAEPEQEAATDWEISDGEEDGVGCEEWCESRGLDEPGDQSSEETAETSAASPTTQGHDKSADEE